MGDGVPRGLKGPSRPTIGGEEEGLGGGGQMEGLGVQTADNQTLFLIMGNVFFN
jgi:hypothetical protein